MDVILLCCINLVVCISILHILLPREDKDVRLFPDQLLLWLHHDVLSWTGDTLWSVSNLFFFLFISFAMLVLLTCFYVSVGAVGYLGSTLFVRRIYRNIKCD
jgi:hypothetical protein